MMLYGLGVTQDSYGAQWQSVLKPMLIVLFCVDSVLGIFGLLVVTKCIRAKPGDVDSCVVWNTGSLQTVSSALVALFLLSVTPRRIGYDNVSGTFFTNVPISDQGYNVNKQRVLDLNTQVDILISVLLVPVIASSFS